MYSIQFKPYNMFLKNYQLGSLEFATSPMGGVRFGEEEYAKLVAKMLNGAYETDGFTVVDCGVY